MASIANAGEPKTANAVQTFLDENNLGQYFVEFLNLGADTTMRYYGVSFRDNFGRYGE